MPSLDISNSEMSSPSRNLLSKVRRIVPPMLESFHKGQLGRVTVVGGSIDYTGAPYFSAMASAKLGCDMSHIICEPSAATVIKSYSPNLMVHPYLQSSKTTSGQSSSALAEPIITFLQRIHVLVVGPGLGRDETTQNIVVEVMKVARERNIPFVLDADGLLLVQKNPELVKGYPECILTPNVVEFGRLAKAMGIDISNSKGAAVSKTEACEKLSMALGGVTIIQKGQSDIISNGIMSLVSDVRGGLKRSGGQGDTLTGSLGTFLAWRKAYHDGLWDQTPRRVPEAKSREHIESELEKTMEEKMSPRTTLLLAAWAGSAITRECSRRAFAAKGRSMQASDLTDEVHQSFLSLIGEPDEPKL